ncbi:MCE family protein [Mycolicibacterium pulveris]|uniref:Mammalian cell entry protein n=1 Tax=Mycolicibacterium pulveris TaxID=36813 RepID=A0A7I7UGL5_MYCPV|nr:MCE family protein [Mycolicibacterium pulveris]MCV6980941.1 MCE family protein [Mycolicibacterium pulveris]BBY80472.1 mammalian cell entry protein [Mycolicibacterium pulveris]
MLKYRGANLKRAGFIGVVLMVLVVAVGLQPERLLSWATAIRYHAEFAEAGGLSPGNEVKVSGVKVGTVTDVALGRNGAVVTFVVKDTVRLGDQTTAHIRTGTLLGARILTLEPDGRTAMKPGDMIPLSRTGSPYSLNEAVNDLTTNVAATDTATLNHSLDTLSATLDQIAPTLGPTFDGLTRLSRSLNSRSETLGRLLQNAAAVTDVLAQRSHQLNTLILNANDLLAVLVERRQAISELLANTSAVARHLTGLVKDNEAELAPTLDRLNAVTAMLEKNRDSLSAALPGLKKFEITTSEAVSSGPYYSAYVPNLIPPELLQPFFDYAFGFRANDPHMPRALFPWPRNGIPGG